MKPTLSDEMIFAREFMYGAVFGFVLTLVLVGLKAYYL